VGSARTARGDCPRATVDTTTAKITEQARKRGQERPGRERKV